MHRPASAGADHPDATHCDSSGIGAAAARHRRRGDRPGRDPGTRRRTRHRPPLDTAVAYRSATAARSRPMRPWSVPLAALDEFQHASPTGGFVVDAWRAAQDLVAGDVVEVAGHWDAVRAVACGIGYHQTPGGWQVSSTGRLYGPTVAAPPTSPGAGSGPVWTCASTAAPAHCRRSASAPGCWSTIFLLMLRRPP